MRLTVVDVLCDVTCHDDDTESDMSWKTDFLRTGKIKRDSIKAQDSQRGLRHDRKQKYPAAQMRHFAA